MAIVTAKAAVALGGLNAVVQFVSTLFLTPHVTVHLAAAIENLVGDPGKRISLVRLASWFNQDRGIVTACKLMTGDLRDGTVAIDEVRAEMEAEVAEEGLAAFCEAHVVPDFKTGVLDIAQASGVGELL